PSSVEEGFGFSSSFAREEAIFYRRCFIDEAERKHHVFCTLRHWICNSDHRPDIRRFPASSARTLDRCWGHRTPGSWYSLGRQSHAPKGFGGITPRRPVVLAAQ